MEKDIYYSGKELNSLLICKICNQKIHDPRSLPCGHSFCNQCIISEAVTESAYFNIFNSVPTKTLKCNFCDKKHVLPAQDFPVNHILNEILSLKHSDDLINHLEKIDEEKELLKREKEQMEELLIEVIDQEVINQKRLEAYRQLVEENESTLKANSSAYICLIAQLENQIKEKETLKKRKYEENKEYENLVQDLLEQPNSKKPFIGLFSDLIKKF